MYAVESENPQAKLFNCVQRAHQNVLEFMPTFISLLLVGGLQYPRLAAVLGLVYVVARYFSSRATQLVILTKGLQVEGDFTMSGSLVCCSAQ